MSTTNSEQLAMSEKTIKKPLSQVEDIVKEIERIIANDRENSNVQCKYYFRGETRLHGNPFEECPTSLDCSLDRNQDSHWKRERELYHRAYQINPEAFSADRTMAERLTRMQHYRLPTRFADLSCSSLSALFFACEDVRRKEKNAVEDGVLRIFKIHPGKMKRFTSDIITAIAHLPLISNEDFILSKDGLGDNSGLNRLAYEVSRERPGFTLQWGMDKLLWREIQQVWAFDPIWNNDRIRTQRGILLAYGCKDGKEPLHPTFSAEHFEMPKNGEFNPDRPSCGIMQVDYIKIDKNSKGKILERLRSYGLLEELVYPDLSDACQAIAKRMSCKANGNDDDYSISEESPEYKIAESTQTNTSDSFHLAFHKYYMRCDGRVAKSEDIDENSAYYNLNIKSADRTFSLHYTFTRKKWVTLLIYISDESVRARLRAKKDIILKHLPQELQDRSDWESSKYPENNGYKRVVFPMAYRYAESTGDEREAIFKGMIDNLCRLILGLQEAGEKFGVLHNNIKNEINEISKKG